MNAVVRTMVILVALTSASATVHAQQQQAATPATAANPPLPALSAEAAAALEELGARFASEFGLVQGWFRDRAVQYYVFNTATRPVAAGRVLWPIHGFDARGNPVAIRGQRPIFSSLPGLPGYSGLWKLSYVVTADHVQPNVLRDVAAVDELVRRKRAALRDTDLALNLPIVPRGSTLARDSTPATLGWFQGREVQYFDFGAAGLQPAPMWRFAAIGDTARTPALLEGQNSLLDSVPVAPPYPDLWDIRFVRADTGYVVNSVKSAAQLRALRAVVDSPTVVRNLPVVMLDGARVPRAPSPLTTFADLRSPFPPAPTPPQ